MGKRIGLLVPALALMLFGCAKPYVLLQEGKPLSGYSKIDVEVVADRFLQTKKADAHYDGYAKSCDDMKNVVGGMVRSWLAQNFHGHAGGPAAKLTIDVTDFFTGSGAARLFLGSMANGHLETTCTITGGHSFSTHAKIAGVGLDKIMAYRGTAKAINVYIGDHL
jgi:hypothetical protein